MADYLQTHRLRKKNIFLDHSDESSNFDLAVNSSLKQSIESSTRNIKSSPK